MSSRPPPPPPRIPAASLARTPALAPWLRAASVVATMTDGLPSTTAPSATTAGEDWTLSRTPFAKFRRSSTDVKPATESTMTVYAPAVPAAATRLGTSSRTAAASNSAIFRSAALRLATKSDTRAVTSSRGALSDADSSLTMARSTARLRNASAPTRDSIRRFDEPTEASLTMLMRPICDECDTWVPAQSSRDQGPPMSTIRTVSPYFSPNSAIAPSAFASSRAISRVTTS